MSKIFRKDGGYGIKKRKKQEKDFLTVRRGVEEGKVDVR